MTLTRRKTRADAAENPLEDKVNTDPAKGRVSSGLKQRRGYTAWRPCGTADDGRAVNKRSNRAEPQANGRIRICTENAMVGQELACTNREPGDSRTETLAPKRARDALGTKGVEGDKCWNYST